MIRVTTARKSTDRGDELRTGTLGLNPRGHPNYDSKFHPFSEFTPFVLNLRHSDFHQLLLSCDSNNIHKQLYLNTIFQHELKNKFIEILWFRVFF